jgi:hypothetical protein
VQTNKYKKVKQKKSWFNKINYWTNWRIFVLAVIFCLSLKIKSPGTISIRPLYQVGMALLFIHFISLGVKFNKKRANRLLVLFREKSSYVWAFLLTALYLIEVPREIIDSARSLKDFIYGSALDLGLLATVVGSSLYAKKETNTIRSVVESLSWVLFIWGVISALVGWLFYFGETAKVGCHIFSHNPVWGLRLHGLQGEPSHFGATVAIGTLSQTYIYTRCKNGNSAFLILCASLLLWSALLASGSKNSIIALLVALSLIIIFSEKRSRCLASVAIGIIVGFAILYSPHKKNSSVHYYSAKQYGVDRVIDSLRLTEDGSIGERIRRNKSLLCSYSKASIWHKLFGLGYGALDGNKLKTSFNSYIDTLTRFGIVNLSLVLCLLIFLAKKLVLNIRNNCVDREACVYAISIFSFSFAFSMFLSTWHSHFFHLANIGFIVAISVVLLSIRTNELVANKPNDG